MKTHIAIPFHSFAGVITNSSSEIFTVASKSSTAPELEAIVRTLWEENRDPEWSVGLEDLRAFAGVSGPARRPAVLLELVRLEFDDAERIVAPYLPAGERWALTFEEACPDGAFYGETEASIDRFFAATPRSLRAGWARWRSSR